MSKLFNSSSLSSLIIMEDRQFEEERIKTRKNLLISCLKEQAQAMYKRSALRWEKSKSRTK